MVWEDVGDGAWLLVSEKEGCSGEVDGDEREAFACKPCWSNRAEGGASGKAPVGDVVKGASFRFFWEEAVVT